MKHRVGLLSFSDRRQPVHHSQEPVIKEYNDRLASALEASGEVDLIRNEAPIVSPADARREAHRMVQQAVTSAIIHQPVFGFPHLAVIAAQILSCPYLVIAPQQLDYPSVNGLLTVASAFAQLDIPHVRMWGNAWEDDTRRRVLSFIRAAGAVRGLRGQVYGMLGGRSMGLYGSAPAPNRWIRQFGVDVDHADQLEIVRRSETIDDSRVSAGLEWLAQMTGGIEYDGVQLTPEKLAFQVRNYLATKDIIADYGWDFVGVKCHYEMSEYYATQCLSASFLNDPYDWEGDKQPTPMSCEADSDGALTMQLLSLMTGLPTALLDIRGYDAANDIWILVNCGASPTWFAARSPDPACNLACARLLPAIPKYAGGGAHVQFEFGPGPVTLARLQRAGDDYQILVLRGTVESRPAAEIDGIVPHWPVAFVRLPVSPERLFQVFNANHLHMVPGDLVDEISMAGKFLGMDVVRL